MSKREIVSGGIIAAGEGSRLRRDGWTVPKALVEIDGTPLIASTIDNFLHSGVTRLTIIVNEQSREIVDWVQSHYPDLDAQFIVKTTASSLESFFEVKAAMPPGAALISTVDAWCPDGAFADFVERARALPAASTVLAVTRFVDDERPLWVAADADGCVTEIGGDSGDAVTAGIYLIPEEIRGQEPIPGLQRLRHFLSWVAAQDETVYCVEIPVVVDVDRAEDVAQAAKLAENAR